MVSWALALLGRQMLVEIPMKTRRFKTPFSEVVAEIVVSELREGFLGVLCFFLGGKDGKGKISRNISGGATKTPLE